MTHLFLARDYFLRGYNCAQSVCAAFCDVTGLSETESLKLASSFGGGFGRMREICGAVSAMGLVLGALDGYDTPDDAKAKSAHYARVQTLTHRFIQENGALLCRDLLSGIKPDTAPTSPSRTQDFYKTRPCLKFVESAAQLLDEYLKEEAH